MKRGIVVYLENKRDLLLQFGCLYTSWKLINAKNTDLIVFGSKETLTFVPDNCVKIEYGTISTSHPFINSISYLADDCSAIVESYEYIMRTDVDTFLTPAWNSFTPNYYCVGSGRYVNDDYVKRKIQSISKRFGLRHKGIYNIGASHYGPPQLIRNVCKLSLFLAKYILLNEFKGTEGKWPGWYKGVTTMYSNEIAVNHLVDDLIYKTLKLDYDSTSNDSILDYPHIHCWHTDRPFSKFEFAKGTYQSISIDSLDVDKIKDYCMYVALLSIKEMDLMKSLLNQID